MANLGNFNADDYHDNYQPVPSGRYTAMIVGSETKPTKAGNGSYLKLEIDIVEGPHKGRKLFDNLNLENPNKQAEDIARATLANICRAVGVLHPKDSSELHMKPMSIMVTVTPETDEYPAGNRVKRYDALGSSAPAAMESKAPAGAKPWEKPAPKADPIF